MKNLQLSLKRQWFEMTKAGIKTEDYREITPYWAKRLLLCQNENLQINLNDIVIIQLCTALNESSSQQDILYQFDNWFLTFKTITENIMTLGYPKSGDTERIIQFEHAGIEIRTGNPEWGAEPDKLYFVIKHGKIIE